MRRVGLLSIPVVLLATTASGRDGVDIKDITTRLSELESRLPGFSGNEEAVRIARQELERWVKEGKRRRDQAARKALAGKTSGELIDGLVERTIRNLQGLSVEELREALTREIRRKYLQTAREQLLEVLDPRRAEEFAEAPREELLDAVAAAEAKAFQDSSEEELLAAVRETVRGRVSGAPHRALLSEFADLPDVVVGTQQFILPVVKEETANLKATDDEGNLLLETSAWALWPNGLYPSTTAEGVEGRLVYAGQGRLSDFDGKDPQGSIVLMEFDCGSEWLNCPMLGASAVVFIEPEEAYRGEAEAKFLRTWLDFPRYWVPRAQGLKLKDLVSRGVVCSLKGVSRFDTEVVENIYAFLPGTNKDFEKELVVIGAYLDGASVAPGRAPGAEAAANLGLFIDVARAVSERGSPRPVLFLITNAHTYGLAGARYFYDLLNADELELGRRRARDIELQQYLLDSKLQLVKALLKGVPLESLEKSALEYADCRERSEGILDWIGGLVSALRFWGEDEGKTPLRKMAEEFDFLPAYRLCDESHEIVNQMLDEYRDIVDERKGRISEILMPLRIKKEDQLSEEEEERKEELEHRVDVLNRIMNKLRGSERYTEDLTAEQKEEVDEEYRRLLDVYRQDLERRLGKAALRLKVFRHNEPFRERLVDFNQMIYFGLDVSSHAEKLAVFEKGWLYNQRGNTSRNFAALASDLMRVAQETEAELGAVPGSLITDAISQIKGRPWTSFLACRPAFDAEVATTAGEAKETRVKSRGITIAASGDARVYFDTPHDTASRVDFRQMEQYRRFLTLYVPEVLQEDGLCQVLNHDGRFVNWADVRGKAVRRAGKRSVFADMPVRYGIVQWYHWNDKTYTGVRAEFLADTNFQGRYFMPGVRYYGKAFFEAARHDPETGRPRYVYDKAEDDVAPAKNLEVDINTTHKEKQLVLFEASPLAFFDLIDQRFLNLLTSLELFDARTQNTPLMYGAQIRNEPVAVVWAKELDALKIVIKAGQLGVRMALLNVHPDELEEGNKVRGRGFPLREYPRITFTSYRAALDMYRMDEWRLRRLLEHNIHNRRIEELHEEAGQYLDEAEKHRKANEYSRFLEKVRSAWGVESRAYPDVRSTQDDTVRGVVFYLFLVLPFAFFLERLIFGFTKIEHQIIGFFGFFVATFLVLEQVHPAFELANAPMIVLLAFVMLALSVIVIGIIYRKFAAELQAVREETKGRQSADVNRLSASVVALRLGISNMRRRKVRTFLTCLTIIILTFTVLSFSSIVEGISKPRVALGIEAPYSGILLRNPNWAALDEAVYPVLRNRYPAEIDAGREGFAVAPRAWYVSEDPDKPSLVEVSTASGNTFKAKAAVGMSGNETEFFNLQHALVSGRWLSSDSDLECVLPRNMVESLGMDVSSVPGKKVRVFGMDFTVVGVLNNERFTAITDQDGEELTPVDYEGEKSSGQTSAESRPEEVALVDQTLGKRYEHMLPGMVVIVPYHTLLNCGGTLRSVAVRFPSWMDAKEEVERLLQRVERVLYVGVGGESFIYSTASQTNIKGLRNLLVPLLIASLIVFNTMVGSVYERIREIGTLSALGLAPLHIGLLFLAESAVYAVIGAIAGYLLGQATAWGFTHIEILGQLFRGLELNYSSWSTVMVTLLVMGAVIVSTLYPAAIAARVAVPSAERHWKVPDSRGDVLAMELPFTFSPMHATGIMAFLQSFLYAHIDSTVGNFYVREVSFNKVTTDDGKEGYGVYFMAWLTPYDLGVSQEVQLMVLPELDQYIMYLVLYRMSGFDSAWKRTNKPFLNVLRKQLLLWRTLGEQEREELSEQGAKLFVDAPEEKAVLV